MNDYFRGSADASQLYRPSTATGSSETATTALSGNLSDFMKNATVFVPTQQMFGTQYYPESSISGVVGRKT
ncbi:hypothetical protein [Delftia tsuruhatensis]|uniref:hypothetical protein n=1 Tax=Delftia tsuruhatensis TaxID=180282 RepID=UPI0008E34721|nr:hypothetical protein [Delftia tsuruhatensis]SFB51012.1 hypothetical protein SAMN05444579_107289 [Delftia tsuruhatensis]